MAFKTIKRPKISLGERFYLQSILGGLWLTIRHLVLALLGKSRNKKELAGSGIGVTMQYPEARWDKHLPKYYRGAPVLVKGEDGRERCVSCQLCGMCEEACPEQAIFMSHNYLFTPTDKTQAIHNKAKLYELGGTRKGLVNKWNQYK